MFKIGISHDELGMFWVVLFSSLPASLVFLLVIITLCFQVSEVLSFLTANIFEGKSNFFISIYIILFLEDGKENIILVLQKDNKILKIQGFKLR